LNFFKNYFISNELCHSIKNEGVQKVEKMQIKTASSFHRVWNSTVPRSRPYI